MALRNRLDEVYRYHRKGLMDFIHSRVGIPEEAEDILQEVFTKAITQANSLAIVDDLVAWIYVSVRNRITDWYRSRKRKPDTFSDHDQDNIDFEDLIADQGLDVEGEFLRSVVSEAIEEAIDDLPDSQRNVVVKTMIEGMTFQELAEETGSSINTLLARKRYAVKNLRARLSEVKSVIDQYMTGRNT